MNPLITQNDIDTYQRDGVVIIRGLAQGAKRNPRLAARAGR